MCFILSSKGSISFSLLNEAYKGTPIVTLPKAYPFWVLSKILQNSYLTS